MEGSVDKLRGRLSVTARVVSLTLAAVCGALAFEGIKATVKFLIVMCALAAFALVGGTPLGDVFAAKKIVETSFGWVFGPMMGTPQPWPESVHLAISCFAAAAAVGLFAVSYRILCRKLLQAQQHAAF